MTDGRVVRRWRRQRGCSPRRDAHRPSNRSRAARPSFASFDLPATPKTSTTPCSSVLFNSPPSSSFGLRMPRILKALEEGTREKRESGWISFRIRRIFLGERNLRDGNDVSREYVTSFYENLKSIFQSLTIFPYTVFRFLSEIKGLELYKYRISIEQLKKAFINLSSIIYLMIIRFLYLFFHFEFN